MVITNKYLPDCISTISNDFWILGGDCWKKFIAHVKTVDQSTATEIDLFGQLVRDTSGGENRFSSFATFIKDNFEKGSDLATGAYKALLDVMDKEGQLYLKNNNVRDSVCTYRILYKIRNAEGESSPIFTQTLPVANSILSGKEVFIRNNMTGNYVYASGSDNDTTILVDGVKENNPRYLWKLKQVYQDSEWRENKGRFLIVNSFENKILTAEDDGDSLVLANEQDMDYWSIFYIRLVQGSSGEEVAIILRGGPLGLDEENSKMPKMWTRKSFEDIPSAVWLLQPKE